MKFTVKNKLISLTGASTVVDENGKEIFKVNGKLFSPTKKKKIYNENNELVYVVRDKYWVWHRKKAFIFNTDKENLGTVILPDYDSRYYFEEFAENYSIVREQTNTIKLLSSWIISKDGKDVARIQPEAIALTDEYDVETLVDDADIPFLVAIVVAIDKLRDIKKERRREK